MKEAKGMIMMGGDFNTFQNYKIDKFPPDQGKNKKNLEF